MVNSTGTLMMVCGGLGAAYRSTDNGHSFWGHVAPTGTTCLACGSTAHDVSKPWHSGPCSQVPFSNAAAELDGPRCAGSAETNGAFFELPAANSSVNASIFSGADHTLIRST